MQNKKIETKLEIKNEANSDVAELYLYGTIRQAYWWDEEDDVISSKRVRKALNDIGDKDTNVHINSCGGDVFESIAIHNTLKQHKGKVNIIIDSLAGSGASVIAMAGDTIKMFPTSMMMIHKAWTYVCGNANDLRKQADDLDKIDSSVKASYKDRFVGTDEELEDLISDESWLTADECMAFGFCDEEVNEEPESQTSVKENLFNKYRKNMICGLDLGSKDGEKTVETLDIAYNQKSNLLNKFKKTGGNE